MAKLVQMLETYASPQCILSAGKHYTLSDKFAAELVGLVPPAAKYVSRNEVPKRAKVLPQPTKADPQDEFGGKPLSEVRAIVEERIAETDDDDE